MECPKCQVEMERCENQFYWRGHYHHGYVCQNGHGLWDDPDDSFLEYAAAHGDDPRYA